MVAGRDPDRAGRLLAQLVSGRELGIDLLESRPDRPSSRSPASVGDTLRVVRVSSRTPSRASSPRMVWLSADCETPSFAAALVKLRSRATATKARRSSRLPRCIHDFRL